MLVTACVLDMTEENATLEVTIIKQQTNISFRAESVVRNELDSPVPIHTPLKQTLRGISIPD